MSRDELIAESPFTYRCTGSGLVLINYRKRTVKTLKGRDAARFLARVESASEADAQLAMARATGHFKQGTERRG